MVIVAVGTSTDVKNSTIVVLMFVTCCAEGLRGFPPSFELGTSCTLCRSIHEHV